MQALHAAGYAVSVPFGENTRYDLVIDDGRRLARVQCKTGRLRAGAVRFPTCSTYAHHANPTQQRRDYLGQIDCFAVHCPDTERVYLIPIEDLPVRTRAALRVEPSRNGQRSGVRDADEVRNSARVGVRYASTSRVFWCARIFRLTRWSALSIVFVSQSRSSAISS